jgi:putative endonuclease
MRQHLALGKEGEDIAMRYLRKKGYAIMDRNVRVGRDEIDIIAYDKSEKMIVFIEVKTRQSSSEQYPIWRAVDPRKRRCLERAIAGWCQEKEYDGAARLDILAVYAGKVIDHIKELGRAFL